MPKYLRRPGSGDSGRDYEIKITALLALRCATAKDTQDMWVGSNVDQVGDFDDVVLCKQTIEGIRTAYLIQLKHQENPKNINTSDFTHVIKSKGKRKKAKEDFALAKYLVSFLEFKSRICDSKDHFIECLRQARLVFVLFTNRGVSECDFLEMSSDNTLCFLNTCYNNKDNIYKFSDKLDYDSDFLRQLVLFSNQVHLNDVDGLIQSEIKKVMGSCNLSNAELKSISDKFTSFVRIWAKGTESGDLKLHDTLTKPDIIKKICDALLDPYKFNFSKYSFEFYECTKKRIWNEIVSTAQITVVDYEEHIIAFLTQYLATEIRKYCEGIKAWSDCLTKQAHNLLRKHEITLYSNNKITPYDVYKSFWLMEKLPLLLQINTVDYNIVAQILKVSNYNLPVIIIKEQAMEIVLKNVKYFANLNDLSSQDRTAVLHQPVQLQGRSSALLCDIIDGSMYKHIKCNDIIKILSADYNIGNQYPPLAESFIERRLSRTLLKIQILQDLNESFIIQNLPERQKTNYAKHILTTSTTESLIQIEQLKSTNKPIHWLIYFNDDLLEWKESRGSVQNIPKYQLELLGCCYNLEELLTTSKVLSAAPGMGKSIFMDYIASRAPITKWVIRVDLNQFNFKSCTGASDYLQSLHNTTLEMCKCRNIELTQAVFEKKAQMKNVMVLLDGLDEVALAHKDKAIKIAKHLKTEGFPIWLTTRPVIKSQLEAELVTIATTLEPFTLDDQRHFLMKYFSRSSSNLIGKFVNKLLQAAKDNLHDWDYQFTGIPLQTKLLADVFNDDCEKSIKMGVVVFKERFNLVYLYEKFIERKTDILCDKFGRCAEDMRMIFKEHQQLFALKIVFPEAYLNELNINIELDEYKIQLMQRDGVITAESGVINFVHRTYAEYLAAQWLTENLSRDVARTLIRLRFLEYYKILFDMFDRILVQDIPLHSAVVNLQVNEAVHLIESNPDSLDIVDAGGRSVLHMIALQGYYHVPHCDLDCVKDPILRILEHAKITDSKDMLGYNPLDYAIANWSLAIANTLCEKSHLNITMELDRYKKDAYFAHCANLKYTTLLEKLLRYFAAREILYVRNTDKDLTIRSYISRFNVSPTVHAKIINCINAKTLVELFQSNNSYNDLRFAAAFGTTANIKHLLYTNTNPNEQDVDKMTALHYAAMNRQLENVKLLVPIVNLDAQNINDNTALHYAVRRGFADIVAELLQNGADTNKQNNIGATVLHFALTRHHEHIANLIMAHGADANIENNIGNTCLHCAAQEGYREIVSKLIKQGCLVNKTNTNGNAPLHLTLLQSHSDIAMLLILNGADGNIPNKDGNTAVHLAAQEGHADVLAELIERNYDVNRRNTNDDTPLNRALKRGHFGVAKLLLSGAADANIQNKQGYYSLHYIATRGNEELLAELLAKGLDANKVSGTNDTPLHCALSEGNLNAAKILLSYGADGSVANNDGNTPLHIAALNGFNDTVMQLVSKCDPNKGNKVGNTALHLALLRHHLDTAKILLSNRADINTSNSKGTALHHAVRNGHAEIVTFLLENGADVNMLDASGKTALHTGVTDRLFRSMDLEQCILIMNLLLDYGADVNTQDVAGNTALHYLSICNLPMVTAITFFRKAVKLLIDKGANVSLKNAQHETALNLAVHAQNAEIVSLLKYSLKN